MKTIEQLEKELRHARSRVFDADGEKWTPVIMACKKELESIWTARSIAAEESRRSYLNI